LNRRSRWSIRLLLGVNFPN